jgi:pSer/pThr/pTyr-binding forkhead associated (FHA) protein
MAQRPSSASFPPTSQPVLVPQGRHAGKPNLPLARPCLIVGASSKSHFHLVSPTISKTHAAMIQTDAGVYIRDLASRSHVLINGKQVTEAMLADGDTLALGAFSFLFRHRGAKAASLPKAAADASVSVRGEPIPIPIEGRTLLIGRKSACDIHLLEPAVSNCHALIFEQNGVRYIRDLHSRTGTFVNGKAIHQQQLEFDDEIRVGDTEMRYAAAAPTSEEIDELEDLVGTARLAEDDVALMGSADAESARLEPDVPELDSARTPSALKAASRVGGTASPARSPKVEVAALLPPIAPPPIEPDIPLALPVEPDLYELAPAPVVVKRPPTIAAPIPLETAEPVEIAAEVEALPHIASEAEIDFADGPIPLAPAAEQVEEVRTSPPPGAFPASQDEPARPSHLISSSEEPPLAEMNLAAPEISSVGTVALDASELLSRVSPSEDFGRARPLPLHAEPISEVPASDETSDQEETHHEPAREFAAPEEQPALEESPHEEPVSEGPIPEALDFVEPAAPAAAPGKTIEYEAPQGYDAPPAHAEPVAEEPIPEALDSIEPSAHAATPAETIEYEAPQGYDAPPAHAEPVAEEPIPEALDSIEPSAHAATPAETIEYEAPQGYDAPPAHEEPVAEEPIPEALDSIEPSAHAATPAETIEYEAPQGYDAPPAHEEPVAEEPIPEGLDLFEPATHEEPPAETIEHPVPQGYDAPPAHEEPVAQEPIPDASDFIEPATHEEPPAETIEHPVPQGYDALPAHEEPVAPEPIPDALDFKPIAEPVSDEAFHSESARDDAVADSRNAQDSLDHLEIPFAEGFDPAFDELVADELMLSANSTDAHEVGGETETDHSLAPSLDSSEPAPVRSETARAEPLAADHAAEESVAELEARYAPEAADSEFDDLITEALGPQSPVAESQTLRKTETDHQNVSPLESQSNAVSPTLSDADHLIAAAMQSQTAAISYGEPGAPMIGKPHDNPEVVSHPSESGCDEEDVDSLIASALLQSEGTSKFAPIGAQKPLADDESVSPPMGDVDFDNLIAEALHGQFSSESAERKSASSSLLVGSTNFESPAPAVSDAGPISADDQNLALAYSAFEPPEPAIDQTPSADLPRVNPEAVPDLFADEEAPDVQTGGKDFFDDILDELPASTAGEDHLSSGIIEPDEHSLERAAAEVIETTDPTPESAQTLASELPLVPESPDASVVVESASLTDSTFARDVSEFAASSPDPIVESAASTNGHGTPNQTAEVQPVQGSPPAASAETVLTAAEEVAAAKVAPRAARRFNFWPFGRKRAESAGTSVSDAPATESSAPSESDSWISTSDSEIDLTPSDPSITLTSSSAVDDLSPVPQSNISSSSVPTAPSPASDVGEFLDDIAPADLLDAAPSPGDSADSNAANLEAINFEPMDFAPPASSTPSTQGWDESGFDDGLEMEPLSGGTAAAVAPRTPETEILSEETLERPAAVDELFSDLPSEAAGFEVEFDPPPQAFVPSEELPVPETLEHQFSESGDATLPAIAAPEVSETPESHFKAAEEIAVSVQPAQPIAAPSEPLILNEAAPAVLPAVEIAIPTESVTAPIAFASEKLPPVEVTTEPLIPWDEIDLESPREALPAREDAFFSEAPHPLDFGTDQTPPLAVDASELESVAAATREILADPTPRIERPVQTPAREAVSTVETIVPPSYVDELPSAQAIADAVSRPIAELNFTTETSADVSLPELTEPVLAFEKERDAAPYIAGAPIESQLPPPSESALALLPESEVPLIEDPGILSEAATDVPVVLPEEQALPVFEGTEQVVPSVALPEAQPLPEIDEPANVRAVALPESPAFQTIEEPAAGVASGTSPREPEATIPVDAPAPEIPPAFQTIEEPAADVASGTSPQEPEATIPVDAPAPEIPPAFQTIEEPAAGVASGTSPQEPEAIIPVDAPAPEIPPTLHGGMISSPVDPFLGMSRDSGMFLGGMPLDLSAPVLSVAPPISLPPLAPAPPRNSVFAPSPEAVIPPTPAPEVAPDIVTAAPAAESAASDAENSMADILADDGPGEELFASTPESLDSLPDDSMNPISDVVEVLGEETHAAAPLSPQATAAPIVEAPQNVDAPSVSPMLPPTPEEKRTAASPRKGPTHLPPRPRMTSRLRSASPFDFGSQPGAEVTIPPFAGASIPAGSNPSGEIPTQFAGLSTPQIGDADVFGTRKDEGEMVVPPIDPAQRGVGMLTALSASPPEIPGMRVRPDADIPRRPRGVALPPLESRAPQKTPLAAPAPKRQLPSVSPRFDGLPPIPPPAPVNLHLRVVLPIILALALATAAAIWFFYHVSGSAEGRLGFDNLESLQPSDKHAFEFAEQNLLRRPDVRDFAMRLFEHQNVGQPDGFLGSTAAAQREYDEILSNAAFADGSKDFVLATSGPDPNGDAKRLAAMIQTLFQENQRLGDEAASAKAASEQADQAVAAATAEIKRLSPVLDEERDAAAQLDAAERTLTQNTDQSAVVWKAWTDAAARLQAAQAAVDRLEIASAGDSPAEAGTTQASDTTDADPQIKLLSDQLAVANTSLAQSRGAHSDAADAANKALDRALAEFRTSVDQAQGSLKDGSQLSAYLVAAQQAQDTIHQINADLIERQKSEQQRLTEFRRVVAEKQETRLKAVWAADSQLQEMDQDLSVAEHRYNAAVGSGLDTDAAELKTEVETLKNKIDARRDLISTGDIYADEVKQLQQFVDDSLKDMEADRARADARMGDMLKALSAAAPKMDKLPADQQALEESLKKQLDEINNARQQQAQAIAQSNPEADASVRKLEGSITELQAKIDARRKQLADDTHKQLTSEQVQDHAAKVAEARAALTAAQMEEADASLAVRAKKVETDAAYSRVEELKTRSASLKTDNARLLQLQAQLPDLQNQAELLLNKWHHIPVPENPGDGGARATNVVDARLQWILISTLGYAMLTAGMLAVWGVSHRRHHELLSRPSHDGKDDEAYADGESDSSELADLLEDRSESSR